MSTVPADTQPLRVTGLTKRYGAVTVLDDVSLSVAAGEVVCIVGPNGSGKTTLVECVEGIRTPDAGTVEILGRRYAPHERRPARLGVQLQEESLPARIEVGEAVALYDDLYGRHGLPDGIRELLDLDPIWHTKFDQLSGGQKRRTVVALALVGDPWLAILDEPASGLDPIGQQAIERLVLDLRDAGRGVCLTLHDIAQAERLAHRVVMLASGRIITEGTPAELVARVPESFCAEVRGAGAIVDADGLRVIRQRASTFVYGERADLERAVGDVQGGWSLRPTALIDAYLLAAQRELAHDGVLDAPLPTTAEVM